MPAAQSLRNKTGEAYRTLIDSFVSANPKLEKLPSHSQKGQKYAWIDELEDSVVRLQANILYSHKKEAERLHKEVVPIKSLMEGQLPLNQ